MASRPQLVRFAVYLVAGASLLAGCDDCGEELYVIAPQIAVDVCKDPPLEAGGKLLGGVRDCSVALGTKDISVPHEVEIHVSNPSPLLLTIFDASFTADSDPAFEVLHAPETVAEGFTSTMVVSFLPLVESEIRGRLVIQSDAENLAEGEDVVIDFSGTGIDNGVPDIRVSPLECDFGRVAKDSAANCVITVENRGQRELIFTHVGFLEEELQVPEESEGDAFGFVGRVPRRDDAIPATAGSNAVTITVRFTPDVLGNYYGKLLLRTNDPDENEIVIPLQGIGVDPPICNVSIESVNGVPAGPNPTIEPLDDVVLSASRSQPSTPDGSIEGWEWTIVQQPPGSTASLTNPTGESTGFTFAEGVVGVDLAGRYRVRATVIDDLGTRSVNECELEFEAIPTDTILTQLTWDTSYGDMDLHLIKMDEQGRFCATSGVDTSGGIAESCGHTDNVCYYGNCKQGNSSRPDWDDDGLVSEGDPSLDIDDLCGYGPENINIDVAVPGRYLVGVDFFGFTGCSGSGIVGNTLRIYLYGQLQAEFYRELENGDWWEVAIINWPGEGGVPCVEDLATPELECPAN